MKLSIIVPIYNAEKYIEKCLKSCYIQDISSNEYEIIVINDGSIDNTKNIVENCHKSISNIKLINKKNGGVSTARNIGLKIAKGDYIWFVDADDWIAENCLGYLLNELYSQNLDALQINFKNIDLSNNELPFENQFKTTEILALKNYIKQKQFEGYAWMTLFRRDIAIQNSIFFETILKVYEDTVFFMNILSKAYRIKRIDFKCYNYLYRSDSAVFTIKGNDFLNFLEEVSEIPFKDDFLDYFKQKSGNWIALFIVSSKLNSFRIYKNIKKWNFPQIRHYSKIKGFPKTAILLYDFLGLLGIVIFKLIMRTISMLLFIKNKVNLFK